MVILVNICNLEYLDFGDSGDAESDETVDFEILVNLRILVNILILVVMVNILILVILVNLGSGESSESDDSRKSGYSSKNCDSGEYCEVF